MTTNGTHKPASPAWLTNGCPPWCHWDGRDGKHFSHRDSDEYAARLHFSNSVGVTLTGTDAPSLPAEDGHGREIFNAPIEATVYLVQHYREIEPRIHLGEDDLPGMYLTLTEAEELAARLLEQVANARTQGGGSGR
jgi:hypothetical protein